MHVFRLSVSSWNFTINEEIFNIDTVIKESIIWDKEGIPTIEIKFAECSPNMVNLFVVGNKVENISSRAEFRDENGDFVDNVGTVYYGDLVISRVAIEADYDSCATMSIKISK